MLLDFRESSTDKMSVFSTDDRGQNSSKGGILITFQDYNIKNPLTLDNYI